MNRKKQPPRYPKHVREYRCAACEFAADNGKEFVAHLVAEHGRLEGIAADLRIRGVCHLDGENFYNNQYDVLLGEEVIGHKMEAGPCDLPGRAP